MKNIFTPYFGAYDKFQQLAGTTKTDIYSDHIKCQVKKYKKNQFQQVDRHYLDDIKKYIPEISSPLLINLCIYPLLGKYINKNHKRKK